MKQLPDPEAWHTGARNPTTDNFETHMHPKQPALFAPNANPVAFPNPSSRSARLSERACAVMPGGNSRHSVYFPPYPVYAVRGKGSRIWDADGVERIDCMNNYSSLIHGHGNAQGITHKLKTTRQATFYV